MPRIVAPPPAHPRRAGGIRGLPELLWDDEWSPCLQDSDPKKKTETEGIRRESGGQAVDSSRPSKLEMSYGVRTSSIE